MDVHEFNTLAVEAVAVATTTTRPPPSVLCVHIITFVKKTTPLHDKKQYFHIARQANKFYVFFNQNPPKTEMQPQSTEKKPTQNTKNGSSLKKYTIRRFFFSLSRFILSISILCWAGAFGLLEIVECNRNQMISKQKWK